MTQKNIKMFLEKNFYDLNHHNSSTIHCYKIPIHHPSTLKILMVHKPTGTIIWPRITTDSDLTHTTVYLVFLTL